MKPLKRILFIMFKAKIKICPIVLITNLLFLFLSSASSQEIVWRPLSIRQPPSILKDYSIVNTIIYPTAHALLDQKKQLNKKEPSPLNPPPASYQQKKKRQDSKKDENDKKIAWKNIQQKQIRDYIIDAEGNEVELTPTLPINRQKGRPLPRDLPKNLHPTFNQFPSKDKTNTRRPIPPFAKDRQGKRLNFQEIGNYIIILIMAIVTFITFIALCTRSPQQQTQLLERNYRTQRQSIPINQQQQPQQQQDQPFESSIIIIKSRQTSLH